MTTVSANYSRAFKNTYNSAVNELRESNKTTSILMNTIAI